MENLTKSFGDLVLFENISFGLSEGQRVGLIAKNGSGKHIGTGLSRAQQVVADHGGIIDLDESPSGGCAAIVEFRVDGDPI